MEMEMATTAAKEKAMSGDGLTVLPCPRCP